jgi:hypothetical protein
VPDELTMPKYKNIPNKTGIGIFASANLPNKHRPIAKCTAMFVKRCSLTSINLAFSPGTYVLLYTVRLAQCANVRTGAAHVLLLYFE